MTLGRSSATGRVFESNWSVFINENHHGLLVSVRELTDWNIFEYEYPCCYNIILSEVKTTS